MCENDRNYHLNTCATLDRKIQELEVKRQVSVQNVKLRDSYLEQMRQMQDSIAVVTTVIDILKPMISDIQKYLADKREQSMQNINNALRLAGEIIADSTEGIRFEMDGDEAWIATPDGLEVDDVEGGGYRQISSSFLRSVILESQQDVLNTMLLDEMFALVSVENSATLSLYLNVICQNAQIIAIEQKPEVFMNIDATVYEFSANDNYADVTKREVKVSR